MKSLAAAFAAAAALSFAPAAAAQDIAGMLAATAEQIGQGLGESANAGAGVFVTAQGKAPLPNRAAAGAITLTVSGSGATAVEAARQRDEELAKVMAAARRFGVTAEPGKTTWGIEQGYDYGDFDASIFAEEAAADALEDAAVAAPAAVEATSTITASISVTVGRPDEARMPGFIDALSEAGVDSLDDSLNGLDLGQFGPFLSLIGLNFAEDPGEAVWNAATADAMRVARDQAQAVASASGRTLGQVRNVTFLMRSQDNEHALVSVAVRYAFAD